MRFLWVTLLLTALAYAANVVCPEHGYATCYNTGQTRTAQDGTLLWKYDCTCGDSWWFRKQ